MQCIQVCVRYDTRDDWITVQAPFIERRKHNECIVQIDGRRYKAHRVERGPWCVTMVFDRIEIGG